MCSVGVKTCSPIPNNDGLGEFLMLKDPLVLDVSKKDILCF